MATIDKEPSVVGVESMAEVLPLIRERIGAGQSVRFSPKGTSMLPMLRQGFDSVTLSPLPERIKKYDIVLYERKNGKCVLHRVVKVAQTLTLSGDNQVVYEKGIERGQLIAVVSGFSRGEKQYAVNYPPYVFYCVFWHRTRLIRRLWRAFARRIKKLIGR